MDATLKSRPTMLVRYSNIWSPYFMGAFTPAVLNRWVATPTGVAWQFAGGRLGSSEICKQSCQRMILYSDAVKIYFTSMSVTEFRVKYFAVISSSYFPVINSVSNRISSLLVLHPIICFLGRFIWLKSPLLSLLGLIYRLSIYNKITATIQYRIIFFL